MRDGLAGENPLLMKHPQNCAFRKEQPPLGVFATPAPGVSATSPPGFSLTPPPGGCVPMMIRKRLPRTCKE